MSINDEFKDNDGQCIFLNGKIKLSSINEYDKYDRFIMIKIILLQKENLRIQLIMKNILHYLKNIFHYLKNILHYFKNNILGEHLYYNIWQIHPNSMNKPHINENYTISEDVFGEFWSYIIIKMNFID